MSVQEINEENFEQEVMVSEKPVMIDFFAPWCGPCKMMAPIFEEVSQQFEGKVKFVKVNTQESQELAAGFQIQSIPTLSVVHKGKEIERWIGMASAEALKKRVEEIIHKLG